MPLSSDPAELERQAAHYLREAQAAQGDDQPTIQKRGVALWRLGEALFRLQRMDQAAEQLDAAQSTLIQVPALRWLVMQANLTRATALMTVGRNMEALASVDRTIGMQNEVPEPPLPDLVPAARMIRMQVLTKLGKQTEAYDEADSLIEDLAPGETEEQRRITIRALTLKGRILRDRGDNDAALDAFEDALSRVSPRDAVFFPAVWQAMVSSAQLHEEALDNDLAANLYDSVIERFGALQDAEAQEAVDQAREGKDRIIRSE